MNTNADWGLRGGGGGLSFLFFVSTKTLLYTVFIAFSREF